MYVFFHGLYNLVLIKLCVLFYACVSQLKFTSMDLYGFQKEFGSHLCAKQPSVHCIKRPLPCQPFAFFFLVFLRSSSFSFKKLKGKIFNNKENANNATKYKNLGTLYFEMMQVLKKRPIAYPYGVFSHLLFRFCGKRQNHVCSSPQRRQGVYRLVLLSLHFLAWSVLPIPTYITSNGVSEFKLT